MSDQELNVLTESDAIDVTEDQPKQTLDEVESIMDRIDVGCIPNQALNPKITNHDDPRMRQCLNDMSLKSKVWLAYISSSADDGKGNYSLDLAVADLPRFVVPKEKLIYLKGAEHNQKPIQGDYLIISDGAVIVAAPSAMKAFKHLFTHREHTLWHTGMLVRYSPLSSGPVRTDLGEAVGSYPVVIKTFTDPKFVFNSENEELVKTELDKLIGQDLYVRSRFEVNSSGQKNQLSPATVDNAVGVLSNISFNVHQNVYTATYTPNDDMLFRSKAMYLGGRVAFGVRFTKVYSDRDELVIKDFIGIDVLDDTSYNEMDPVYL